MSAKNSPPPVLHELESEIMEELWSRSEPTPVRDVLESLNKGPRERAYTTVMTIMRRLDVKGVLARERRGKTDYYAPVMTREAYREARAAAEVGALVAEFGDVALVHFSRQVAALDPDRARALRRLAQK